MVLAPLDQVLPLLGSRVLLLLDLSRIDRLELGLELVLALLQRVQRISHPLARLVLLLLLGVLLGR
ncbi:MAG: hypothetical protein ACK559_01970 [bacterium]